MSVDLFSNLTAKDLLSRPGEAFRLVWVLPDEVLWRACSKMIQAPVSAIAVRNNNGFTGWLDVLDLASIVHLLNVANAWAAVVAVDAKPTWSEFAEAERKVLNSQVVAELVNVSTRDAWVDVPAASSARSVLSSLCSRRDIRRIAIKGEGDSIMGIVSPFDALLFVHRELVIRRGLFQDVPFASLFHADNAKPATRVISVRDSTKVMEAFSLMAQELVSGVAVVDDSGKLVSVLSASDFMRVRRDGSDSLNDAVHWGLLFSDLNLEVREFLTRRNRYFPGGHSVSPIVLDRNKDSVADMLNKVVSTHIHRLFEVDEHGRPVAVWALTDLLRVFVDCKGVQGSTDKKDAKKKKDGKKSDKKSKDSKKGAKSDKKNKDGKKKKDGKKSAKK